MAVLPIRTVPDPVLRKKTKRVSGIDKSIKKLVADMQETLHAEPGRVGLAAPQVGVSLRITVICLPEEEEDIILINGEIVRRKGQRLVKEGCLSIPGYIGEVNRAEAVTAKGLDINGKEFRIKAEGLLSQALEHEIDHLNGVLYVDRLENPESLRKILPEDITEEQMPEETI
ncbi:MAG: peptide deformylase [Dehalococcoidales bacterium]